MTSNSNKHFLRFILLPLVLGFSLTAFAQEKYEQKNRSFCSDDNYYSGKKGSFRELREITAAAGETVNVDALKNGGISVKGENRSDVLVRACVQSWGDSNEDAASLAKNLRIQTNSIIRAENLPENAKLSVSYEILVPRSTNLSLTAHNGGISVSGVEGNIEFTTTNGGVSLRDAAGNIKGKTQNGGVNVVLSGNAWRGSGLDVETTNGGIILTMPENYAARIETGTVNGGFTSDIQGLKVDEDQKGYGRTRKQISTDLNGGGAPVRVVTTNGGIKIVSLSVR